MTPPAPPLDLDLPTKTHLLRKDEAVVLESALVAVRQLPTDPLLPKDPALHVSLLAPVLPDWLDQHQGKVSATLAPPVAPWLHGEVEKRSSEDDRPQKLLPGELDNPLHS